MSRYFLRPFAVGLLATAGCLCFTGPAACASPSADDKALATMLFEQGRALLAEGHIPEACQKLAESQRLDPGGGTLLNLALCHEREGRLARSWSEFKEAEVMARRDGRRDRELEAANHVRALEPRLSRLTIVVPASTQVEGLLVERDGREVGRGAWAMAIPIDGGEHVVRATALGKEPFSVKVVIAAEFDSKTVEIPVLATPVVLLESPRVSLPEAAPAKETEAFTPARLRWAGLGTAAAGVALLAGGGYALATALNAKSDSNSHCWVDGCDGVGLDKRRDAVSRGNLATVLGVSGGVLIGAGATLFYLGLRASAPAREARSSTRFVLSAAPGHVATGIAGGF